MKYTINAINQLGILEYGLSDKTDLTDWVLLDYMFDWQQNPSAGRINDMVWFSYKHFIAEMPLVGIKDKSAISRRVKKLNDAGLITVFHCPDTGRLFVKTTALYFDVTRFKSGDTKPGLGVDLDQRGVDLDQRGVDLNQRNSNTNNSNTKNSNTKTHTDNPVILDAREKTSTVGEIAAAEVCVLWMSLGVMQCNPVHPDLLALIAAGAAPADFDFAGRSAVERGKGFGYALGIVRGLLADRQRQAQVGNSGNFGGQQRGNHGKSGGGRRIEHSRRIGEHLDRLIAAEFGSEVGIGAV